MHPMINIALRAARDASEALAHSSDRLDRVDIISHDEDNFVTSMDHNADKTILYHLQKAYPEHCYDSRVSGLHDGKQSDTVWLIDPLLGSQNFATGYPQFAVSIACQINGVINHAVVVNPLLREEFTASRGTGAQLNSRRLRSSPKNALLDAMIAMGTKGSSLEVWLKIQEALRTSQAHIRMSGCSAIDMVLTAAGRIDGGYCAKQSPQGLAAAALILRESGGFIGDGMGGPEYKSADELIFGSPKVFRELVKLRAKL